MKRRKPKDERKETSIRIRVTFEQKATMDEFARKAGLDTSGWMRFLAMREIGK